MSDTDRLQQLEENLSKRIQEANAATRVPLSSEEISDIIKQVVSSLSGDVTPSDLKFYSELEELAAYIRKAKTEIASIQPKDISDSHIPLATDELDAVVGATEEATNKIMDACDVISEIGNTCPDEAKNKLMEQTTGIFEACNFQDITGQRITKVVQTLKYIDTKIGALLEALGDELGQNIEHTPTEEEKEAEAHLLNGPQLPQNAIDQDEIDKLLGGF